MRYDLSNSRENGNEGSNSVLEDELECVQGTFLPLTDIVLTPGEMAPARELTAADIVVVVMDQGSQPSGVTNWDCGVARFNDHEISTSNHANGYVVVDYTCLLENMQPVAHEVGHLLGFEHDLWNTPENFVEINLPITDNHGHYNGISWDVMYTITSNLSLSESYSSPLRTFGQANETMGNLGFANQARVVGEQSWSTVAAYRPLVPDPKCSITFTNVCEGGLTDYVFSAFDHSGVTILDTIFERKIASGPWETTGIFEDVINGLCIPTPAPVNKLIRLRATMNTLSGLSQCEADIFIPTSQCGTQPEL